MGACENRLEKERRLTQECQKEESCKTSGLCTGSCAAEPCRCITAKNADCQQTMACASMGVCTAVDGKCVVGGTDDCRRTATCRMAGFCTPKEGKCVIGGDADCKQAEQCKTDNLCTFKDGGCIDATMASAGLINPALANDQAPEKYKVKFTTTKGDFVVEVTHKWAPIGADRFYNLAKVGYFRNSAFFRMVGGVVAQFGVHANPDVTTAWRESRIRDEPSKQPNDRGTVAFVTSGPNSRSTQLLINLADNRARLDKVGVVPIGKVVEGMNVVDALNKEYGDGPPEGNGPDPIKVQLEGNKYLKKSFPKLDYITLAALL